MPENFTFGGEIVWHPSPQYIERSHLIKFMDQHDIGAFPELLERSTSDVAWFTDAIIKYLDIQFQQDYTQVVDLSEGIQFPKWCVEGKLNIAYNCVDKWAATPETRDRPALIWEGEESNTRKLEVNRCTKALNSLGLGKGDSIGL